MNQSNISVKHEHVPLAVVGEDHGVLHRLDHDELVGLPEVLLERAVRALHFVVPLPQLGVLLVPRRVHLARDAQKVGLEEDPLHERVVREVTEDVGDAAADRAERLAGGVALGESGDALDSAVDVQRDVDRRGVVPLEEGEEARGEERRVLVQYVVFTPHL